MKKWILCIGIAVAALIIVALVVVFMSLNGLVKKGVETVGPQLTKTEVRLAASKISPLSGRGQLSGLFIGNPEGFKTESAIKLGDMKVDVDMGSLLSDPIVVEEINIQGPEITFEAGLKGSNLNKILENLQAASGDSKESSKPEEKSAATAKKFRAKEIVITGGKIHVSVIGLGDKPSTVPLQDIRLQNIGSDGSGVSLAQLTTEILVPLIKASIKASGDVVSNIRKDISEISKDPAGSADKVLKGVQDLLKKK